MRERERQRQSLDWVSQDSSLSVSVWDTEHPEPRKPYIEYRAALSRAVIREQRAKSISLRLICQRLVVMERRRERPVDLITLPYLPYPFTLSSNLS